MNIKKFLLLMMITFSLVACNDDDSQETTDTNSLIGTVWRGQETNDGIYTFAFATTFTFVDSGETPVNGTYTFNGGSGVLTEETGFVANFTVSGAIMSVVGVNSTRVYVKQ